MGQRCTTIRPGVAVMVVVACMACMAGCGEGVLPAEPESEAEADAEMKSLEVTATAYTSSRKETDRTPYVSAFNERLVPGEKVIAISRDLEAMGLTHNTEVEIEGLEGTYRVADRTNRRWKRRIDLYMGDDRRAALQWGKRKVTIRWPAAGAE